MVALGCAGRGNTYVPSAGGAGGTSANSGAGGGGDSSAGDESSGGSSSAGVNSAGNGSGGMDGGGMGNAGSAGTSCVAASADPCVTIARFGGPHVVDGAPDDFCTLPARLLSPQNAAFVEPPDAVSQSSAAIRVAWSPAGLHLHVGVVDENLLLVAPPEHWHGDNVQLMISSIEPTTGVIPGPDNAANQMFMTPPSGTTPAAIRTPYEGTLPLGYEYAARATATGYEVELFVPWQGGYAPSSGNVIGFDIVIGVKDDATTATLDFEYGLYEGDIGGAAMTAACLEVPDAAQQLWCDSRFWCRPSLE